MKDCIINSKLSVAQTVWNHFHITPSIVLFLKKYLSKYQNYKVTEF